MAERDEEIPVETNRIDFEQGSQNGANQEDHLYEANHRKLSYWKTESSEELKNITVGQLVQMAADKYPHTTAFLFFGGAKLTFGEVLEKVDTLAASFENLGLRKGDLVALWGFNSIEWCISFLAICRAGLVAVNLSPLYEGPEILSCLRISDVRAIVMDEGLGDRNFYDILKSVIPEVQQYDCNCHIVSDKVPLLRTIVMISEKPYRGTFKWNDLFDGVSEEQKYKIKRMQSSIKTTDVCDIQFTSGTTGQPKGVMLTHLGMINTPHFFSKYLGLYEKYHRVCLQVPLFHVYGTITGVLGTLLTGSTLVLPSAKFSPNKSIDCIISEKCTVVHGTPTMYTDLLTISLKRFITEPDIFKKMSSIEVFHAGGAVCLPETVMQLKKYFKNARFTWGFGMSETSTTVMMSMPWDSEEVIMHTTGRVMDHMEVKVVDENDRILPLGVPGEMCFKGYMIMKGYYKEPEKTKAVLKDGWLYSGDRFILLENGYAQVVGRIKDIIIRGGENIEPKEIEEVLTRHPDVIDAQVYGIQDMRLGEVVAAAIIKTNDSILTEDSVKTYCQDIIASYKIPQHVIFLSEFPKTASGKIQKFKLKEMTESSLNKR